MNARYAHNGNARIYVNKKHTTYEKTGYVKRFENPRFRIPLPFPIEKRIYPSDTSIIF